MQLDPDLNLKKAKKMARQQEAIRDQSRELKKEEGATLDAVRCLPEDRFLLNKDPSECHNKKHHTRCGSGHLRQDKCPAKEVICHNCLKKGH